MCKVDATFMKVTLMTAASWDVTLRTLIDN